MRTWAVLALLVAISASASCRGASPEGPAQAEVRAAIEARNAAFGEAVRAGDAAAIAQHYTPDGAVLPPNAPAVTGTEALAAFWGEVLASGIGDAKLTAEEVTFTSGDFATEVVGGVLRQGRRTGRRRQVSRVMEEDRGRLANAPRHLEQQPCAAAGVRSRARGGRRSARRSRAEPHPMTVGPRQPHGRLAA